MTGFVVLIPIFLTVYILVVSFRFIDGILGRYLNPHLKNYSGFYIPGIGFLLFFLIIILVGFIATRFIGRKIFRQVEKWFSNLPLINKIYPTLKQIVLFILAQESFGFKKVVLVEYPSKGIWSVGFLTNEEFGKISNAMNQEMVSVFVPSSPGPLTGYVIFVPKEELKFVDISISDALKIIISGGVFKP
jgi:uncharacterized membrane protein